MAHISADDDWLLNCIALVKAAPGMWVPTTSARGLELFLLGYMKARHDLGLPEYGRNEANMLEAFRAWLCEREGHPYRCGTEYCIEQMDPAEDNILTYVRAFEEFLQAWGRALPEPDREKWMAEDDRRAEIARSANFRSRLVLHLTAEVASKEASLLWRDLSALLIEFAPGPPVIRPSRESANAQDIVTTMLDLSTGSDATFEAVAARLAAGWVNDTADISSRSLVWRRECGQFVDARVARALLKMF